MEAMVYVGGCQILQPVYLELEITHKEMETGMSWKYEHVIVVRVLDGDTLELHIDMGNETVWQSKFRLYGIDTPEIHGASKPEGEKSAERFRELLVDGIQQIETLKSDKYGRYLVNITLKDGRDAAQTLISEGMGKPYFGGTKT